MSSSRDQVRSLVKEADHSREVILQVEHTLSLQEATLSEQRAFIITGDPKYLEQYNIKKVSLGDAAKHLTKMAQDSPVQKNRADKIVNFVSQYTAYLDLRVEKFKDFSRSHTAFDVENFNKGLSHVEILHDTLTALIHDFLLEENDLFRQRTNDANEKREQYGRSLILSLIGACALIMLMNWIVLQTQRKHFLDSERLRNIDDRHKVAVRAANDGIFDWNIAEKTIFLSSQIFTMCGYNKEDYEGSVLGVVLFMSGINPLDLIHHEDVKIFRLNLDNFVSGLTSEYDNIFRVKHADGHWVWIHARGGGIFDKAGKPIRLIGSHSNITIQKRLEDRLKKEKEEADYSSKMKMEFLTHMSHEIRTPLTTVTGVAEILERQSGKFDEKAQSLVRTLLTSSATLKDLINDVLDFSRIDSGQIKLDKSPVQINALMKEIISIMSVQAIEKNIGFSSEFSNIADLVFDGDQHRLRQILINLVANAIKFTQVGSVHISVSLVGLEVENEVGNLIFKVVDTGIGIPEEYQDLIFDKFRQVDETISKGFGGTGLGLPISRSLAEMMNGTISVESEIAKGSTFTLEMPVKILNINDLPDQHKLNDQTKYLVENKIFKHLKKAVPRILIVEDYEGNVVVIGYILEELGYTYDIARNGLEALEKFENAEYAVILMDIQMPVMDGITATIKLRQMEAAKGAAHTSIIGMTAHATYKDKEKCLEVGMDRLLFKPIDQKGLAQALYESVENSIDA